MTQADKAMAPEEAPYIVPTKRSEGITRKSSMYQLEEAKASPKEALCTHRKKR
jgi:hypothetical protein